MSTLPDVDGLIRRTRRYEFADGLVELQVGVLLALVGALSHLVFSPKLIHLSLSLSQTLGSWARWLTVLIVLLPTLVAFGTHHVIKYVRRRWLWRTSGFVEPLSSAVPRRALVLATALVVISTGVAFALSRAGWGEPMLPLRMLVASVGWAQGIVMFAVGRATGLAHYAWLGIVGGLASTPFLFLHLAFGQTWLAFCLLWGLAFTASGLFSLRRALLRLRKANEDG